MNCPASQAAAAAIVAAHQARFGSEHLPPQPTPVFNGDDPVYRAALIASSQLGFIAADAQCIAHAWKRQVKRTGMFDPTLWPEDLQDFTPDPGQVIETFLPRFEPIGAELGLYAVLPDAQWVHRMAHAGVPTVQLRFKSTDRTAITQEIRQSITAVQGTGARLFINDHWREAMEQGAYGVHLGQEDLDALTAQELHTLRTSGLRLGVSTHGYAEMLRALAVSPSYIALGAVFPTTLKKMATAPQGLGRLHAYARLLRGQCPLVAIGGIGHENFPAVLASGVGSVAVVRALVNAPQPEAAAAELLAAFALATKKRGSSEKI